MGYLDSTGHRRRDSDGGARNAAAFVQGGEVVARYFKHHLPNYGVFDEARYFKAGSELGVVTFGGVDIGLTICEDVWQDGGPFAAAAAAEVGLLVNINGSPYERNKDDVRLNLVQRRAVEAGAPWSTSTSAAARTSWSSTATPSSSAPTAACWPGRRSSWRSCSWWSWICRPRPATPSTGPGAHRGPLPGAAATAPGRRRAGRAAGHRRPAGRRGRGLGRAGHRNPRLHRQERLLLGGARNVRRHRLGGGGRHRRGRDRRRERVRRGAARDYSSEHSLSDAVELAANLGAPLQTVPIAPMVERVRRVPEADRPGRGERAGPGARHHADGAVQPARPPGAGHRQQERAGGRVLHDLRRRGRRLRPDQGRAQDPGVAAGALAQRRGGRAAA